MKLRVPDFDNSNVSYAYLDEYYPSEYGSQPTIGESPTEQDLVEGASMEQVDLLQILMQDGSNRPRNALECQTASLHISVQSTFCSPAWDSLLCWPNTRANSTATQPCFSELRGIKYDVTRNATRWCHQNGSWDPYINYSDCREAKQNSTPEFDPGIEITSYIFFFGYTISMLALILAITIFLYFKDLRCLRNSIHTNLMFTYILANFMWILTLILQSNVQNDITWCIVLIILYNYFHLTNFFWMFVEGLYLYMLVVETFYTKNMKFRVYAAIGWGGPVLFIMCWATAKFIETNEPIMNIGGTNPNVVKHCPWMTYDPLDWIYQTPALILLATNFIFLLMIMWVLITKLRSANSIETQQYRKATKALVVLIPLLGTTYILVISGPSEGVSQNIYDAVRAFLISTQGFTIALFYCFLNSEVQNTLRHYVNRWKESRALKDGRKYRYHSKDWSHRSRTESIRLCTNPPTKRESSASETTTTTLLGNSSLNGGRSSNSSSSRIHFLQTKDEILGE